MDLSIAKQKLGGAPRVEAEEQDGPVSRAHAHLVERLHRAVEGLSEEFGL